MNLNLEAKVTNCEVLQPTKNRNEVRAGTHIKGNTREDGVDGTQCSEYVAKRYMKLGCGYS